MRVCDAHAHENNIIVTIGWTRRYFEHHCGATGRSGRCRRRRRFSQRAFWRSTFVWPAKTDGGQNEFRQSQGRSGAPTCVRACIVVCRRRNRVIVRDNNERGEKKCKRVPDGNEQKKKKTRIGDETDKTIIHYEHSREKK